MKLNIIMPVYNIENYVEAAIDSVLKQTYQDFTLIVIDDGSTDSTAQICLRKKQNDSRIKVLQQENKGVSAARNYGLNNLDEDCEYLGFIDGDDCLCEDMYAILLNNMVATGSEISCCEFGYMEDNGTDIRYPFAESEVKEFTYPDNVTTYLIAKEYNASLCNKVFLKRLAENLSFEVNQCNNEDIYFGFLCQLRCRNLCYQRISKYIVRKRKNSATRSALNEKYFSCFYFNNLMEQMIRDKYPMFLDAFCTYRMNSDIVTMRKIAEDRNNFITFKKQVRHINKDMRRVYQRGRKNVGFGRKIEGFIIGYAVKIYYVFYKVAFRREAS